MNEQDRGLEPITPGEILKEEFPDAQERSSSRVARDLDVPAGRLSENINGKRAITADTALRLEKYFGVSAQYWLNLQSRYDLKIARREIWPSVEPRVRAREVA